ncbi:hypothetical protein JOB18_018225 [Solea senegalensis]|uniref:Uncharacterized protein n=1 Tax=Solea senegalensis TaxID=28829 RepID=A0AAV6SZ02_SOLSE|nr:hypothetical protein JOB18_018225 [Solea senegalensis]
MSAPSTRQRTFYARCQSVTLAHQRPDEGDIRLQDMSKTRDRERERERESRREFKAKSGSDCAALGVYDKACERVNGPSVSSQSFSSTSPPLISSCQPRCSSASPRELTRVAQLLSKPPSPSALLLPPVSKCSPLKR